jgi:hypothetical protein
VRVPLIFQWAGSCATCGRWSKIQSSAWDLFRTFAEACVSCSPTATDPSACCHLTRDRGEKLEREALLLFTIHTTIRQLPRSAPPAPATGNCLEYF